MKIYDGLGAHCSKKASRLMPAIRSQSCWKRVVVQARGAAAIARNTSSRLILSEVFYRIC